MKNRSRKCLTVIIGAALIAAPIVSTAQNTAGNISNYELLQQIRNLQQEVAELRDRLDQQEYAATRQSGNQQAAPRALPSQSQIGSQTGFSNYPNANQQNQSQNSAQRFEGQNLPQGLPQGNASTNATEEQRGASQAVNRTNTGPVIEERDLSSAVPLGQNSTSTAQETTQTAPIDTAANNNLRVEDRVISPQQPAPVRQNRPSSSVANPQADLLRNGDKAIQTSLQEEDLYAKGLDQLKRQQYERAVSLFNSQLQSYPRGQRSADAYYWIGESLYILESLDSSKKSYQSILTLFPSSRRVPNALFKVAKIENEQGNQASAKATLQSLFARYPNSAAAAQAKASLSDLL